MTKIGGKLTLGWIRKVDNHIMNISNYIKVLFNAERGWSFAKIKMTKYDY